ncbi:aspartic peptidase domain-containing protein [Ephemerocybe angulata]|uniref:Aspartic peptidase domain-containing protein n=1 Tax=Ephemerocybe angulata TaxID=980116 RepID=A0A8H6M7F8_9AGAR|nr:aspartic peptidase domain-containing protein [Tulosesus angulatus]
MLLPLSLLLLVVEHVHASRIPFIINANELSRRDPVSVGNTGNAQYVANITVAGNSVPVLLDTGSSDLWVYFSQQPADPSSITDTGKKVEAFVRLTFGGYTVNDQAFLLVEDTSSFTGDIRSQGYQGLFGLGPNSGSVIRKGLDKNNADTMLQNVFNGAKLKDNYITLLLDRKNDLSEPFKGEMTISEVVPGFENITAMPRLDVETVTRLLNGVIGPDGLPIAFDSIVPRAPDGQLVAVIDSGFTFSQVPRDIADAIYGRVNGAVYDSTNEWWLLPCGQYLNISFNFGGRNYPVHPLDVVDDNFSKVDATGKKVCIGSFQPITSAFSLLGHYDMILGMNFLRSVYTLYNFGSWIENGTQDNPYIQMSSFTDPVAARKDFVQLRLAGQDTISDSRWALLPASQMQKSPVSDEEKKKKYQEMVLSRWPYILLGCLVFTGLTVGFCIYKCCQRRKRNGGKWTQRGALSSGLFSGGKRRGNDDQDNAAGMNDIAERDRETELYHAHSYPASAPGRASVDTRTSRLSDQYGVKMDPRNPFGSTAELVRTQSNHSNHSLQAPASPYQQNYSQQQHQGYDYQQNAYAGSSPNVQQYPQQSGYNSSYDQTNAAYSQNHGGYDQNQYAAPAYAR